MVNERGLDKSSLLCEASIVYEEQGMSGFQSWVRARPGTPQERSYLEKVEGLLLERNGGASTRVYSFTPEFALNAMRLNPEDRPN